MKTVLEMTQGKEYVCPQVEVEVFATQNVLATSSTIIGLKDMDVEKDTIDFEI